MIGRWILSEGARELLTFAGEGAGLCLFVCGTISALAETKVIWMGPGALVAVGGLWFAHCFIEMHAGDLIRRNLAKQDLDDSRADLDDWDDEDTVGLDDEGHRTPATIPLSNWKGRAA